MVSKASIQRPHTRAMVEVQREVARQCSGLKQVIRQVSRGTSQISRQIVPCRDLRAAKIFPPGKAIRKHNHRSLRIKVVASRMPASNRTRGAIQVLTSPMSAFANHPLAIAIHIRGLTMLTPLLEIRVQTPVNHLMKLVNRIQVLGFNGVASAERKLIMALVRSQGTEMWHRVSCDL